jgi:hypothetical protein
MQRVATKPTLSELTTTNRYLIKAEADDIDASLGSGTLQHLL